MLLKAGETARVALRLTPLRAGPLTVTGLEWVLNGHAPGYRLFAERRAPTRRTASRCAGAYFGVLCRERNHLLVRQQI